MIVQGGSRSRSTGPRSRSTGNFTNGVIDHVPAAKTTSRNGTTVGTLEKPMILVVAFNTKPTFVYQSMMARTKQHQIIELRFASS